jgi:Domain of unknown function (DUF1707)
MHELGDDRTPRPAGYGRQRASNADREQVIDTLKDAFVQGRLTKEELDSRVGDVLASRTYADLTALTADLPAGPRAPQPAPKHLGPRPRRPPNKVVQKGVRVITATTVLTAAAWVGALLSNTDNQVVGVLVTSLTFLWFGVVLMVGAIMIESRHQPRSDRQLPPARGQGGQGGQGGHGGQGSWRTISTDPAGRLRPGDYRGRHAAEASRSPLPRPRLTGYSSHWTPAAAAHR